MSSVCRSQSLKVLCLLQCYKHVSALLQRAYHRAKKRSKVHVLYALSAIVRKSKERLAAKDQYGELSACLAVLWNRLKPDIKVLPSETRKHLDAASRLEPILLELSPSLAELERKQQVFSMMRSPLCKAKSVRHSHFLGCSLQELLPCLASNTAC